MLDKGLGKLTLFSVNISNDINNTNNALILSGCKLLMLDDIKYSELNENNYFYLNNNDYGYSCMNIDINFDNNYNNPYFNFYVNCITIKIDNKIYLKKTNNDCNQEVYTKINKNGKLSIGIGYFFKSLEEIKTVEGCNSFMIEGFIALNKKNNVYGFMCEILNDKNTWKLLEGNTYKLYKKIKIDLLNH